MHPDPELVTAPTPIVRNGAPPAPQGLSAAPLELAPAVCRLLEQGLEAGQRHLLLALLQQCGRDLDATRWRLVVEGARLVPSDAEGGEEDG